MKIAYSPRAIAQITQAFNYIARDDRAAASEFLRRIEVITSLLSQRPQIGRRTSRPEIQVVGLLPYRYLMFYTVRPYLDEIRIVRVRHMSRKDAADVRDL